MIILSMTATFGKLSHETLRLKPGMNIIPAPNEWGKSTWCAFIVAMLYGIDTRQQTTKAVLADKERYAPWSGEPMSGRMELLWKGRSITIERSTKGRIPFGDFRAYETDTGLDVPELTAANCGQVLLGVERNVFTQAGFVRLQDMPVTQNETLRRRLNNLVTTGDENSAGDHLGKNLRELKNKVRHNRTGLLPQAEYERDQLRAQLQQQQQLLLQIQQIRQRQAELEQQLRLLENHADHLRYEAAKQGVEKIRSANDTCAQLQAQLTALEKVCKQLPDFEDAQRNLKAGQELAARQRELLAAAQQLPPAPVCPQAPVHLLNVPPQQAITNASTDYARYQALDAAKKKQAKQLQFFGIAAGILLAILIALQFILKPDAPLFFILGFALLAAAGIVLLISGSTRAKKRQTQIEALFAAYPGIPPARWISQAEAYAQLQQQYLDAQAQYERRYGIYESQRQALDGQICAYAGTDTLDAVIARWESILQQHTQLSVKRRELQNAKEHALALSSVATTAPEPNFPDTLTLTASETGDRLQRIRFEQKDLQIKLGQCIGQADAIGQAEVLKARLSSVIRRISRLEDYYRALELAQDVLYQATTALQRRFAPRISKRAQTLFSRLTGGRYSRISLSDDLRISASAENEDTLRGTGWRSDGTVDQLYLSLRLAVAEEVTPDAPLILDDALLRFDDDRLRVTLEVLKEEAQTKQVILFSCQTREQTLLR